MLTILDGYCARQSFMELAYVYQADSNQTCLCEMVNSLSMHRLYLAAASRGNLEN